MTNVNVVLILKNGIVETTKVFGGENKDVNAEKFIKEQVEDFDEDDDINTIIDEYNSQSNGTEIIYEISEIIEEEEEVDGESNFRIDSDTGEKITQGFIFDDGEYYTGSEEKALEYAKKLGFKNLDESYEAERHYWTEWHE